MTSVNLEPGSSPRPQLPRSARILVQPSPHSVLVDQVGTTTLDVVHAPAVRVADTDNWAEGI
ncbi:hypothetical protein JVT61DRAFT_14500 [Boletus reticuloceps]|uniref:Uncharacterized protein n=1 Tax=Boletus reticuloceps TaxID=495285 RepID=A0A8I2YVK1_9AGAM|nr:hypothetical protein JVT61DRAFT_14500 [Boletus reticuloceps]